MRKLIFSLLAAVSIASAATLTIAWPAQSTTGATAGFNVSAITPGAHTVTVLVTGTPGGCTARLEGSIDGVNWFDLSGAQTCTSNVMFHIADRPVQYVRGYLITLSGGSSPTAAIRYLGVR